MMEDWLKKAKEEIAVYVEVVFSDLMDIGRENQIEMFWVYERFRAEMQTKYKNMTEAQEI